MKAFLTYLFLYIFIFQSAFAQSDLGIKKVVIDAGHGGKDVGCVGTKANEKDIALAIALKLGKIIKENFDDVEVIYTRQTDVFLELHERTKIANDNNADLFICIHANAGNKTAFGTETFVMGLHKNDANLRVAKRENASILMEENHDVHYEGFDPNSPESIIILMSIQSAFIKQSLDFSEKIQEQFTAIKRNNRGVKQAGFFVLYKTTMPSVLIETGFLSNKEEEQFLVDEKNQYKMANAIFKAFEEYKIESDKKIIQTEQTPSNKPDTTTTNDLHKNNKEDKINVMIDSIATQTPPSNTVAFKVQIASSSQKLPLEPSNFKGLENVGFYEDGGMYKYTIGNETNLDTVSELLQKARESGYKDAFIVALVDGKRTDLNKAIKMVKE